MCNTEFPNVLAIKKKDRIETQRKGIKSAHNTNTRARKLLPHNVYIYGTCIR